MPASSFSLNLMIDPCPTPADRDACSLTLVQEMEPMHLIKIRESVIIEAFDGPTAEITSRLVDQLYAPVRENKRRLFEAALNIEHSLQMIISHYFFGRDECNRERAKAFETMILTSDWCSFAAKRKMIQTIIEDTQALSGQKKADYEQSLSELMKARNAFTHGHISTDGRRVKLAYHEGGPKVVFLDDPYLKRIEEVIEYAWRITHDIALHVGQTIVHGDPTPFLEPPPQSLSKRKKGTSKS